MQDKTPGKMPHFFYHNSNISASQKLANPTLMIRDIKLPELLNSSLERDEKFNLLRSFILTHDTEHLNQKIRVNSHTTIEKEKHIPPCWATTVAKREYSYLAPIIQDSHLTTTLANIIATNELNFTSLQMASLFRALMAKKVNFSTIDESPYLNLIHPKSGNNPLKSLIVSCFNEPEITDLLHDFIGYIGSDIAPDERLFIINNQDNFEYESMRPAEFLLRLGHEDLALHLYHMGAEPTPQAFRLACSSYGTTIHYEEAMECIKFLMNCLDLSTSDLLEGQKSLQKASPTQYNEMLTRISRLLYEESNLESKHSSLFEAVRKEYLEHYQDTMSLSFQDFCKNKANIDHPLTQKYALLRIKEENVGNGFFSEYYRTEPLRLAEKKWTLLSQNQKANQLLLEHIDLIVPNVEHLPMSKR